MRWIVIALVAACGPPMYAQPGQGPDPTPNPTPSPGPNPTPGPSPGPSPSPRAAPSPRAGGAPKAGTIAARFVAAHNAARAKHCAGPLAWSDRLAKFAQQWADTLKAKGCAFGHSNGDFGENLAAGTEGVLDPEATVAMWYDEIHGYRFPNGGFSMKTGHFTQLVWRDTTQVGCGHAVCNGNDLWVCEYDPPGNVDGEYAVNVRPLGCR